MAGRSHCEKPGRQQLCCITDAGASGPDGAAAPNCAIVLKSGSLHMDSCKLRGCYVWVGPSTTLWATHVKIHGASFGVLVNGVPNRVAKEDDPLTSVTLTNCAITSAQFCGIAVDRIRVKCKVRVVKCTVSGSKQGDGVLLLPSARCSEQNSRVKSSFSRIPGS